MTTYVIGDVQGCSKTLYSLLAEIEFQQEHDKLIFAGDLVNRGPHSLETLNFVMSLGKSACCVLGNHDLYMLMCACGGRDIRAKDTFADVLLSGKREHILNWLICQPLILQEENYTIVHAGLLPQWTVDYALNLGEKFSQKLKSIWDFNNLKVAKKFFSEIWDNAPNYWDINLSEIEKYRVTVNAMTRMRFLDRKARMDFSEKAGLAKTENLIPWFNYPNRQSQNQQIICGHWSAVGLKLTTDVALIDSGCVWGRKLTALRLPDRQIFQVSYCD